MKNKQLAIIVLIFSIFSICIPFVSAANNIIVTRPRSGKVFTFGNNIISWDPPEGVAHVKIDLYMGMSIRLNLEMFEDNSGEYIWVIEKNDRFEYRTDYQIMITGITIDLISGMSPQFSINLNPTEITEAGRTVIIVIVIIVIISIVIALYDKNTHKIRNKVRKWKRR